MQLSKCARGVSISRIYFKIDKMSTDVPIRGVRLIAIEEAQNYEKIVYSSTLLKMAGGRKYTPGSHLTP